MSAQTGILWINGRDLATDFAFAVISVAGLPGNLGSAPRMANLLTAPELSGELLDPRLLTIKHGSTTIEGIILGSSQSDALTKLDALKGLCGGGEVSIRSAYATDRYCLGILDSAASRAGASRSGTSNTATAFDGTPQNPGTLDGYVYVTLVFSVKDGVAFRLAQDGITLSTNRASCPVGTDVSYPVFTISGGGVAFTNPVITVRNAGGDSVQTMGFTISGGINDVLMIDSLRSRITVSSAGTLTDGTAYWTSGDFPLIRPADGWFESAAYPTVALSSDTGTMSGIVTYQRRYI